MKKNYRVKNILHHIMKYKYTYMIIYTYKMNRNGIHLPTRTQSTTITKKKKINKLL